MQSLALLFNIHDFDFSLLFPCYLILHTGLQIFFLAFWLFNRDRLFFLVSCSWRKWATLSQIQHRQNHQKWRSKLLRKMTVTANWTWEKKLNSIRVKEGQKRKMGVWRMQLLKMGKKNPHPPPQRGRRGNSLPEKKSQKPGKRHSPCWSVYIKNKM